MRKIMMFLMLGIFAFGCAKETETTKGIEKKSKSDDVGISIVPEGDIYMNAGDVMQLEAIPLIDPTIGVYPDLNWYTNDQDIVYAYWNGMIEARHFHNAYPSWGDTAATVITVVQYRRNPKYNGHNNMWLTPYQDRVVVRVID